MHRKIHRILSQDLDAESARRNKQTESSISPSYWQLDLPNENRLNVRLIHGVAARNRTSVASHYMPLG
jgi:hypothetical protein